MEEQLIDEEETEVTFTYKNPIIEKDEHILALQKEKEQLFQTQELLKKENPELKENLRKTKSNLAALQKTVKQKSHQINQQPSPAQYTRFSPISMFRSTNSCHGWPAQ